jgi:hypothetical protein
VNLLGFKFPGVSHEESFAKRCAVTLLGADGP